MVFWKQLECLNEEDLVPMYVPPRCSYFITHLCYKICVCSFYYNTCLGGIGTSQMTSPGWWGCKSENWTSSRVKTRRYRYLHIVCIFFRCAEYRGNLNAPFSHLYLPETWSTYLLVLEIKILKFDGAILQDDQNYTPFLLGLRYLTRLTRFGEVFLQRGLGGGWGAAIGI